MGDVFFVFLLDCGVATDLRSLERTAALHLWLCRGQQIPIAGYVLDQVHEGGAGVGARSDVNDITGTAKLESGLRLQHETDEGLGYLLF